MTSSSTSNPNSNFPLIQASSPSMQVLNPVIPVRPTYTHTRDRLAGLAQADLRQKKACLQSIKKGNLPVTSAELHSSLLSEEMDRKQLNLGTSAPASALLAANSNSNGSFIPHQRSSRDPVLFPVGTTCCAFIINGATIFLGHDGRVVDVDFGTIESQKSEKCVFIVDGIGALRAGSQMEATKMFEVVRACRPDSVLAAATCALQYLHTPTTDGLSKQSVSALFFGFDHKTPKVYRVRHGSTPENYMYKPEEVMLYESIGSGLHCSNRVLARGYKRQMVEKEAIELIKKCLLHAALGDISTGGKLKVLQMTADDLKPLVIECMDCLQYYLEFYDAVPDNSDSLFVLGLGPLEDRDLRDYFRAYGDVAAVQIIGFIRKQFYLNRVTFRTTNDDVTSARLAIVDVQETYEATGKVNAAVDDYVVRELPMVALENGRVIWVGESSKDVLTNLITLDKTKRRRRRR